MNEWIARNFLNLVYIFIAMGIIVGGYDLISKWNSTRNRTKLILEACGGVIGITVMWTWVLIILMFVLAGYKFCGFFC